MICWEEMTYRRLCVDGYLEINLFINLFTCSYELGLGDILRMIYNEFAMFFFSIITCFRCILAR